MNGYHTEKDMHRVQTWENTRLDPHDKTTVHMYNLNVSHSAEYKCHILYSDDSMTDTVINLRVTGMSVSNLTYKNVFDKLFFHLNVVPMKLIRFRLMDGHFFSP